MRATIATIAKTLLPGALLPAFSAQAQTYPDHAIKMIVPYFPGTGIDILAGTVGQKLSARTGQPVVVEHAQIKADAVRPRSARIAAFFAR